MLDYKLVEAMAAVLTEGGFDRAANVLNLTQSAVSQRVRLLEEQVGQVLVVRSTPPSPTRAGALLLRHWRQVASLEDEFLVSLAPTGRHGFRNLAVGVNADSLATWFVEAVAGFVTGRRITLDLQVDDQEQTQNFLKSGAVMGAVSSYERPVQGCTRHRLGVMAYRLAASPAFAAAWFKDGVTPETVAAAPAVIFNRRDLLHHRLLGRILGAPVEGIPTHYVPSSERFVDCIAAGFGYGAVPRIQGDALVAAGALVWLTETVEPVELHWHVWNHRSQLLEDFTAALLAGAGSLLD